MTELAKIVGTSQQYVSKKSKEGEFPASWAYEIEKKYGLLTRWIMTGNGPKTLEEATRTRKLELLSEIEEWLADLTAKEPSRKEWFEHQFLDNFSSFKEWREEKRGEGANEGSSTNRKVA